MADTELTCIRKPTRKEKKVQEADVVFEREEIDTGRKFTIYGCVLYESWQQWGAPNSVLFENMSAINNWRNGTADISAPMED